MAKYAVLVVGPAGSGKSTLIARLMDHYRANRRGGVHAVNMDPAADEIPYEASVDVRDAISVQEAMREHHLGPNGALIWCMEAIIREFHWFDDAVGEFAYDFLLIDFPGQVELFSHLDIIPSIVHALDERGYRLATIFLLDAQFMYDAAKFLSGSLVALSTMILFSCPHLNFISKCDLLSEPERERLDAFCEMDTMALAASLMGRPAELTRSICEVIDEFQIVQWQPLDPTDEDYLVPVATAIDMVLDFDDDDDTRAAGPRDESRAEDSPLMRGAGEGDGGPG